MKKTLTLLIVLLVCVQSVLASSHVVTVGSATPSTATTPTNTQTPTAGTSPATNTERIYTYSGTGTQRAFSTTQLGAGDKPAGWTEMTPGQVYYVDPSAVQSFMDSARQFGSAPAATFDGNIVFTNDKGEVRIIDGPYVYNYDANGNVVSADATRDTGDKTQADIDKRAADTYEQGFSQFGSFSNILSTFVSYYRQYSGMSGWSSLIFDEEFLAEWREGVNHVMCDVLSLPTQQCWVSKICDKYTDIGSSENGVAFVDGAGGVPQAFAHIEGERGMPIVLPNQTSWVYTITFSLSNPSDEESMSFNVHFRGPKRSATWWVEAQTLKEKETVSVLGASSLMKLSNHDYNEVCLEFNPSVETPGGRNINTLCNTIVQYAGGATAPYKPPTNATGNESGAGGAAPSTPATPGAGV